MSLRIGDIVNYNLQLSLNFVLVGIDGNRADIIHIVSPSHHLRGKNGVYTPGKKDWLMGRKTVHLGDVWSCGLRWGGEL